MTHGWPATIDPIQLAKRGERLAGTLPIRQLPRLSALCDGEPGDLDVSLNFTHSETEDLFEVQGHVRGEVPLTCQRCLEPMSWTLATTLRLTLLRPSESEAVPEQTEVLVVGKPLSVADIIEDELLLAMPMIPMHPLAECPAGKYVAAESATTVRKNPFAALAPKKTQRRPNKT